MLIAPGGFPTTRRDPPPKRAKAKEVQIKAKSKAKTEPKTEPALQAISEKVQEQEQGQEQAMPSYLNSAYINSRVSSISSRASTYSQTSSSASFSSPPTPTTHQPFSPEICSIVESRSDAATDDDDDDDHSIYPSEYAGSEEKFPPSPLAVHEIDAAAIVPAIPARNPLRIVQPDAAITIDAAAAAIPQETLSLLQLRAARRAALEMPIVVRVCVLDEARTRRRSSIASMASLRSDHRGASKVRTRFVTVMMPRKDYMEFFAADDAGVYKGLQPYRLWKGSELEAVYKAAATQVGTGREKARGFLGSVSRHAGTYFIAS